MGNKLCMYLPPFAGDYSGVCSALFDLGGMICIHDAAGCTGNYTHFDEPRWFGSDAMVYCTGLRKMEAILGDDEKFIRRIIKNAEEKKPAFIAIVGSPVPNVIGFDFNGVARAIENRTGIPSFGFATAGITGSYKDGLVMASLALMKYYEKNPGKKDISGAGVCAAIPGISPLDMQQEVYEELQDIVEGAGVRLAQKRGNYGSLEYLQDPASVGLNLVFNQAGMEIALYMKERYGTPYIKGFPVGKKAAAQYQKRIKQIMQGKDSPEDAVEIADIAIPLKKGLIVADAVIALSINRFLEQSGLSADVLTVSGRFEGAIYASNEDEIMERINREYDFVMADPLLLDLIEGDALKIVLPHYAVSSRVGKKQNWNYLDESRLMDVFEKLLKNANKKLA